jgi:cytochrome c biogenesis protein CcmG, thiol:disulfide interchange protein DsbE
MSVRPQTAPKSRNIFVLLPLLVFLGLAAMFFVQLMSGRDISAVPSALIGQPAPETKLPPLEGAHLPGLDSAAFVGKVTLVNVWGSWCVPCRDEHPLLLELSRDDRFAIAGLNYKDQPENARRFLGELGNPYQAIGVDGTGRTAIDWGVYGVPETFLIGKDGKILYKHIGPLTPDAVTGELLPRIEKAAASQERAAPSIVAR